MPDTTRISGKTNNASKRRHTSYFIVFGDGVGTTKLVGPFADEESAKYWEKGFWKVFYERFCNDSETKNRTTPVSIIHLVEYGELPTPAGFLREIPDQSSTGEFFL